MKVTRGREVKLTGVLSWQEVDKIQKSPFAFSKKNFLKSFSSGGGGGEGEREGKKKPPVILISLLKLVFA